MYPLVEIIEIFGNKLLSGRKDDKTEMESEIKFSTVKLHCYIALCGRGGGCFTLMSLCRKRMDSVNYWRRLFN